MKNPVCDEALLQKIEQAMALHFGAETPSTSTKEGAEALTAAANREERYEILRFSVIKDGLDTLRYAVRGIGGDRQKDFLSSSPLDNISRKFLDREWLMGALCSLRGKYRGTSVGQKPALIWNEAKCLISEAILDALSSFDRFYDHYGIACAKLKTAMSHKAGLQPALFDKKIASFPITYYDIIDEAVTVEEDGYKFGAKWFYIMGNHSGERYHVSEQSIVDVNLTQQAPH